MRKSLALILMLAIQAAIADDASFPKDSIPIDADALKERISGKDFVISHSWAQDEARFQFHANGMAWLNLGRQTDKGAWRTNDSHICVDWKYGTPGCFEVRESDGHLFTRWGELRPN